MPVDYQARGRQISIEEGVDPDLMHALYMRESGYDPTATSPKGAYGIGQLMPDTAKKLGVDPTDPEQNMRGSTRYFRQQLRDFGGDIHLALAAYNAGPGAVHQYGGIPPYPETQKYVKAATDIYHKAKGLFAPSVAEAADNTPNTLFAKTFTARDPRQAIIDEGLRIKGQTRADYGTQFDDPAFVDQFFDSTLAYAQAKNPKLTLSGGYAPYLNELKSVPTLKTAEPPPEEPKKLSPPAGIFSRMRDAIADDISATYSEGFLKNVGHLTLGAATDLATGVLRFADELGGTLPRRLATLPPEEITGQGVTANKRITPELVNALSEPTLAGNALEWLTDGKYTNYADALEETVRTNLIGEPKTATQALGRGLATFLVPFLSLSKAMRVAAPGLSNLTRGVTISGLIGAVLPDPESPTVFSAIDKLARVLNPTNPNEVAGDINRYIQGALPEDVFMRRWAQRGLHAAEFIGIDLLFSGAAKVFRMLRGSKEAIEADTVAASNPKLIPERSAALAETDAAQARQAVNDAFAARTAQAEAERAAAKTTAEEAAATQAQQELEQFQKNLRVFEQRSAEARNAAPPAPRATLPQGETAIAVPPEGATAEEVAAYQARVAQQRAGLATAAEFEQTPAPRGAPIRGEATVIPQPAEGATAEEVAAYQEKVTAQRNALHTEVMLESAILPKSGKPYPNETAAENAIYRSRALGPETHEAARLPDGSGWIIRPKAADVPALTAQVAEGLKAERVGPEWIHNLLDQVQGDDAKRLVLLGMIRGLATAGVGEVVVPDEALASEGVDTSSAGYQIGKFALMMAIGIGGPLAIRWAANQLVKHGYANSEHLPTSVVRDLQPVTPSTRPRIIGTPLIVQDVAQATGRILTAQERLARTRSAVASSSAPTTVLRSQGVTARLANISDKQDVQDYVKEVGALLPTDPAQRRTMVERVIGNLRVTASGLGESPEYLEKVAINSVNQEEFATKAIAATTGGQQAAAEASQFAQRLLAGEDTSAQMLQRFALATDFARTFRVEPNEVGQTLGMYRQLEAGQVGQVSFSGHSAGSVVPTGMTVEKMAARIADASPEAVLRIARRAADPSLPGALSEAMMSLYLTGIHTPIKAGLGGTARLFLEVVDRFNAGLLTAGRRAVGLRVPEDAAEVEDAIAMLHALADSTPTAARIGVNSLATGETRFLEAGSAKTVSEQFPQFTKEAFGAGPGQTFGNVPYAGAVIDYTGSVMRAVSERGLVSFDEAAQFGTERMEIAYHASRLGRQMTARGEDVPPDFIDNFVDYASPEVLADIKHNKAMVAFMNGLLDPEGGFAGLRKFAAKLQEWSLENPVIRAQQFPFVRGLANLLTAGLEHTPLINLMSSTFRQELSSANPMIRARAQGKLMTSLELLMFGAGLGATGIIVGPVVNPREPETARLLTQAGRQPNSFNLFGYTISMDPNEALSSALLAAAQLGAVISGKETAAESGAVGALYNWFLNLVDNRFILGSIGQLYQALHELPQKLKSERSTPGDITATTLDRVLWRSLAPPPEWARLQHLVEPAKQVYDSYWQELAARSGVFNANLPTQTDRYGRPVLWGGGVSPSMWNQAGRYIFGVSAEKIPPDELSKGLVSKDVHISEMSPTVSKNGVDIPLQPSEVQAIKTIAYTTKLNLGRGPQTLMEATLDVIRSPLYQASPAGEKSVAAAMVHQVLDIYTEVARQQFLSSPDADRAVKSYQAAAQRRGFIGAPPQQAPSQGSPLRFLNR